MKNPKFEVKGLLVGLKNLFGVGIHLLIIGILVESLTIAIHQKISYPIPIALGLQIVLTVPCILCLISGMVWFNKTLKLVKIHIGGGQNKLVTDGPFNYVRHPLYATLLISLPPLMIIWYADILFIVPWLLMFVISHYLIMKEELGLVRIFGEEYKNYIQYVPGLIPFKGSGGKRFREYNKSVHATNQQDSA